MLVDILPRIRRVAPSRLSRGNVDLQARAAILFREYAMTENSHDPSTNAVPEAWNCVPGSDVDQRLSGEPRLIDA